MGGFAWVTLATNDSYSLGALVLAHSLKQAGTKHQLAVLVTPGVTNSMRQKLAGVFDLVQEVNVLDSKDEANLHLLKRPELGITFTKLHCWRLTQFEKCVFLDADTLVLKNSDELFDREEFSAAPDVGWPDCFNSGVFVYKPSKETFDKLIEFALATGSFDGGDQGLLNLYFNDWAHKDISRHLPFVYNTCSTACYSYLPAFKQFGTDVKIIHFIGAIKPWLQYFNTESKQVQPGSDMQHLKEVLQIWWDIFCTLVHSNLDAEMCLPTRITPITHCHREDHIVVWDPWEDYQPAEQDAQFESHNTNAPHPIITEPQTLPLQLSVSNTPNIPTEKPSSTVESPIAIIPQSVEPTLNKIDPLHCNNYLDPVHNDGGGPSDESLPSKGAFEHSTTTTLTSSSSASSPSTITLSNSPYELVNIADAEDATDGGLAGAFAQFNLGAPRSQGQLELEEHMRRQSWETGNIDYMGRDAFDKIWSKISETIATPPETGAKESEAAAPSTPIAEEAKPVESTAVKTASEEKKPEEKTAAKEEVEEAAPVGAATKPVELSSEPRAEEVKQTDVPVESKTVKEDKLDSPMAKETKVEAPKVETPKPDEVKPEIPKTLETEIPNVQPVIVGAEAVKLELETPKTEVGAIQAEDVKQETPKVEQAKAESSEPEVSKEKTKTEESKLKEAGIETPNVEEPKVEITKVDESKPEEPKTEIKEIKPEGPKVEETKVEPPKTEETPKYEEAKLEGPKTEEDQGETPKVEDPKTEEVKSEKVRQESPKAEEAKSTPEAPKVGEIKSEPPKTEQVKADDPKIEEVKEIVPNVDALGTGAPKTEEVKTEPLKEGEPKLTEVTPEILKLVEKADPVEVVAEVKVDAQIECKPCDKPQEAVADKPVETFQKPETPALSADAAVCPKAECTKEPATCPKDECPLKLGEVECPKQETVPETPKPTEVAAALTSEVPTKCPKPEIYPKESPQECPKSEAAVKTATSGVPTECSKQKSCPTECPKQETPKETSKPTLEEPQKVETLTFPATVTSAEAAPTPVPATTPQTVKIDTSATASPQRDVPATPEIIGPTPPTTPAVIAVLPAEAAALEAKTPVPETPPIAEAGESGDGVPVPPPRKSSGGKKPKKK